MRRVHVRHGIKQRMGEILGEDVVPVALPSIPEITPWSIQAAMLENVRRVSKSITGSSTQGRVMSGLVMSCADGNNLKINSGIGVTTGGDVIVLGAQASLDISQLNRDQNYYVSLDHKMAVVSGDRPEGMTASFIGGQEPQDIVYDDMASSLGSSVVDHAVDVFTYNSTSEPNNVDKIYLGKFKKDLATGVVTITRTINVGFSDITNAIAGLFSSQYPFHVLGDVVIDGDLTVTGASTFKKITVG